MEQQLIWRKLTAIFRVGQYKIKGQYKFANILAFFSIHYLCLKTTGTINFVQIFRANKINAKNIRTTFLASQNQFLYEVNLCADCCVYTRQPIFSCNSTGHYISHTFT